jgi:hypothetical protein
VKILSSGFIFVGILWGLAIYWMDLVMTGITDRMPLSSLPIATVVGAALVLLGPILLICGPIFVLSSYHLKLGSILTLLGCVVLTVYVGYGVSGLFSMRWADAKAFFPVFAVVIPITLLCDAGAIRLYQLASTTSSKLVS